MWTGKRVNLAKAAVSYQWHMYPAGVRLVRSLSRAACLSAVVLFLTANNFCVLAISLSFLHMCTGSLRACLFSMWLAVRRTFLRLGCHPCSGLLGQSIKAKFEKQEFIDGYSCGNGNQRPFRMWRYVVRWYGSVALQRHRVDWLSLQMSRPAVSTAQPAIWWVPGVMRPGRKADDSSPAFTEVYARVELYFHFPICLHGIHSGQIYI